MTKEQIEAKLSHLERMMSEDCDTETLATLNRCYEKLLFMEPSEEIDECQD